jgi:alkylhydroperoxidase family enzyme
MSGLSNAEIAAILEANDDGFTPGEAALLRMADAMADTPAYVSDELYAELRRHYSEEQLIELATDAGLENLRARFNRVFDIDSDGICSIMDHREAAAAASR